ncbi:unannotated protein [freshwater metagenome]|uniref:Unannotated protein n=1 Tax=freshwater metagenome TaxID=449393 RepID=A0A6J6MZI7_9ZZZZ|nr:hypothetical protein [Actinomycetota bacterium]
MSVGEWQINAVDGADVRLRSGRIGLVSVDVSAPVASGLLHVSADEITLTLNLALDQLKTGNFLLQSAARSIVTRNKAHELVYSGKGPVGEIWSVTGIARAGSIEVELDLTITPIASATAPMGQIEIVGSANMGTVHLPIPGMGTIEDFSFEVDAKLALLPKT